MGGGASVGKGDVDDAFVSCQVWKDTTSPQFIYPELRPENASLGLTGKQNFGLALSGGGFRACTAAVGTLRGLHLLGVYKQARYSSSNSGGSWANGPLCYSSGSLDEFLGPYLAPEQCSSEAIDRHEEYGSHPLLLSKGEKTVQFVSQLAQGVLRLEALTTDTRDFWSRTIDDLFFHKYSIQGPNTMPALVGDHENKVKTNMKNQAVIACNLNERPFPIINGSLSTNTNITFAPVEFTPLYYGLPSKAVLRKKGLFGDKRTTLGGTLMEPHGFTVSLDKQYRSGLKKTVEMSTQDSLNVSIPKSPVIISVSEQAGISSGAIAQNMSKKYPEVLFKLADMPRHTIWDPASGLNQEVSLADGGGTDNTAILALLRRKVTKIVACYAMNCSIADTTIDHCGVKSSFYNIAGLFGRAKYADVDSADGVTEKYFNDLRRVFPAEDFDKLLKGVQEACRENKPAVYLLETTVLPNDLINVPGGHKVAIVFVLIYAAPSWLKALPQEVQARITHDQSIGKADDVEYKMGKPANLLKFPYTSLKYFSYTPALVNLMSNMMTWQVVQSKPIIDKLLAMNV